MGGSTKPIIKHRKQLLGHLKESKANAIIKEIHIDKTR
jgi:hypothetical protein